jgi:hypothetical protein
MAWNDGTPDQREIQMEVKGADGLCPATALPTTG